MPEYFHSRMAELIVKYLTGNLSDKERIELDTLIQSSPEKRKLFDRLTDENYYLREVLILQKASTSKSFKDSKAKWNPGRDQVSVWRKMATIIWQWPPKMSHVAVAACIIGLCLLCYNFFYRTASKKFSDEPTRQAFNLDNIHNGIVGFIGYEPILKNDSEIIFPKRALFVKSTTIKTMNSAHYKCLLPDGSKICMAAASTITIPEQYGWLDRPIDLEGGAYFDVVPNPSLPFRVTAADTKVEV